MHCNNLFPPLGHQRQL